MKMLWASVTHPRWLSFVYFSNVLWSHLFYFIPLLRIPNFNIVKSKILQIKKVVKNLTLLDSTQSQEFKSDVCAHELYTAMHIKTHLDNTLYLSSLLSDQSKWEHFFTLLNLRILNLRSSLFQPTVV